MKGIMTAQKYLLSPSREVLDEFKKRFEYHPDGYLVYKIDVGTKFKKGDIVKESTTEYNQVGVMGKSYLVHKIIDFLHNGDWFVDGVIDHTKGNKKDNRNEKLRRVSKSENNKNVNYRGYCKVQIIVKQNTREYYYDYISAYYTNIEGKKKNKKI